MKKMKSVLRKELNLWFCVRAGKPAPLRTDVAHNSNLEEEVAVERLTSGPRSSLLVHELIRQLDFSLHSSIDPIL